VKTWFLSWLSNGATCTTTTRWVVDTRGKIGRVDGRFVHWVRGYDRNRTTSEKKEEEG
jgi:hypothetical protein